VSFASAYESLAFRQGSKGAPSQKAILRQLGKAKREQFERYEEDCQARADGTPDDGPAPNPADFQDDDTTPAPLERTAPAELEPEHEHEPEPWIPTSWLERMAPWAPAAYRGPRRIVSKAEFSAAMSAAYSEETKAALSEVASTMKPETEPEESEDDMAKKKKKKAKKKTPKRNSKGRFTKR
jgi:hypothetical protein